jgi:hypothetical protein
VSISGAASLFYLILKVFNIVDVVCLVLLSTLFLPLTRLQDAWDGYRANRNRVLNHLYDNKIDNTMIMSGDSHANWVSDLACEYSFVGT